MAFSRLQLPHVISMIHAENQPSIRVAQRLRMRLEGRTALLDHPVLVYGIRRVGRTIALAGEQPGRLRPIAAFHLAWETLPKGVFFSRFDPFFYVD